jgi:beta-1,4-N-acetylglucosaminyltransferase
MLQLLAALGPAHLRKRSYIHNTGDDLSVAKVLQFEQRMHQRHEDFSSSFNLIALPRARRVGQSYLSAVGTSCVSFLSALLNLTLRPYFPSTRGQHCDLVIVNGPGTCVVVIIAFTLPKVRFGFFP